MRKFLVLILTCATLLSFGQQEPQYSNYQMNNFMLNPGVAGSYQFGNAKMGYRGQWLGMDGSPRTLFTTFHMPIHHPAASKRVRRKMAHHGVGATIFHDRARAIDFSGFSGTYSAHVHLNKDFALSLGASFGVKNFRLDGTLLQFVHTSDDPKLNRSVYSQWIPDANAGLWLYSEKLFFGVAGRQLLQGRINLGSANEVSKNTDSKLYGHYFVTRGMLFDINYDLAVVPSFMVQQVSPAPIQVDLNSTFWWRKQFAVGFSYRNLDALYLIFDYVYDQKLEIGYAFDFTISELTKYNVGTHEIIIGIRWGNVRPGLFNCPSKFW